MFSTSPFQFLPSLIVSRIVEHTICNNHLASRGVEPYSDTWKELLRPLLYTCHNLRAIARPLYFSRHAIAVARADIYSIDLTRYRLLPLHPDHQAKSTRDYPACHLVKTLDIIVDMKDICSGMALDTLTQAHYNDGTFPLVRRIELFVCGGIERCGASHNRHFAALVRWIKQMAPNVKEIEVWRPDDYTSRHQFSELCYEIFVAQLLQLVGCIQQGVQATEFFWANIKLNAIGNLAHIECVVKHYDWSIIELARLSSETLESLIIGPYDSHMSPQFAQDKDRGSVVYPRLHTLKLSNHLFNKEMLYPVSTNVVPFPSLRILKLKNEYTFGDDVLFRGNSATLEVLYLHLSSVAMAVIRHLNVFTPTSHPKLRSVRFCGPYELVPELFATKAEALKLALQIGPAATTRDISMCLDGAELTRPLIQLGGLDSIQYLSLSHSKLELWDVIALIKALPMMSDLSVEPLGIGPLPDDVTLHELPDYMVSTYAPMGEHFRCWHLIYHDEMDHAEKVRCVFLVALVCPNLTRVTYPWRSLQLFVDTMEDAVDSDLFIDYEPRLRHLIDHRTVFWGADCW